MSDEEKPIDEWERQQILRKERIRQENIAREEQARVDADKKRKGK